MTDIASLGIVVRTDGVQQADQQLKQLAASGDAAAQSQAKLGESAKKAQGSFDSRAIREQKQALSELLGQIDPAVAALGKLDQQEQKLRAFRAKGLIDSDTYADFAGKINDSRNALAKFDTTSGKAALSAKQLAFATRGLPAQFTDIAVGLSSGQRPLQVLLQQGGQIKDTFGGVGPALRAVAGYIIGLINPITILVGGIAALTLAWKQGGDEARAFNQALILTGNYAGTTSDALQNMARDIDGSIGTQRNAAKVLTEVAGSGKFTAEQIRLVGEAAIQMEAATGKAVSETVKEFARLKEDPVQAVAELNEKYNFLTEATYEQIKALQAEGRAQDAATLAIQTFAGEIGSRTGQIRENLGLLERSWESLTGAASKAWDAMLGIGRAQTTSDRIEQLREQIAEVQNTGLFAAYGNLSDAQRRTIVDGIRAEIAKLEGEIADAQEEAAKEGAQRRARQLAIALDQEAASYGSAEEKRVKRIAQVRARANEAVKEALAAGNEELVKAIRADEARIVKAIEAEGAKKPKRPRVKADPAEPILARLRQQIALNKEELDAQEKLTVSDRLRISVQTQLKEIQAKLTGARKEEIAALLKELEVSGEAVEAQQKQIKLKEDLARLTNQLAAAERNRADANRIDLLAISGIGREEFGRAQRRLDIEREYAEGIRQLRDRGVAEDSDSYREQLRLLKEARDKALLIEEDYQRQRAELISDWRNGARGALQDYLTDAENIAQQSYDIFARAFSGLEDVITNFVTTGKGSFKGFLDSLQADITRFVVRQLLSKWIKSLIGGLAGGGGVGGFVGDVLGSVFGGGRATGGPVRAGMAYEVGERRPEVLTFHDGGRQFLIPSRDGKIENAKPEATPAFMQTVNLMVEGRLDRRTQYQISREVGQTTQRAMARG